MQRRLIRLLRHGKRMRSLDWRWVFIFVAGPYDSTMIVSLLLALALVPSVHVEAPECPDVQIVGVRGSGQFGFGEQVDAVVSSLETKVRGSGRSVTAESLAYPAISISDSFGLVLLNGQYDESVRLGAESLQTLLGAASVACPETHIVLVGYSQGAQVIKIALADPPPASRIAAVAMLADPTREPSQRGVVRLGGRTGLRGGSFDQILLPGRLRPITVDVCAPEDSICEQGGLGFAAHIEGYAEFSETVVSRLMPFIVAHRVIGPAPR